MSVAGLKKQFNKVNQYMSEKIGGAKGTELDDEFVEMEKKIDVMGRLVDELMARTHEVLQPNPASRAKMAAVKSISKLRGQANQLLYPQPEGQLGECMIKHGRDLGDDSIFGQSLIESGEAYKQLADVKYALEDNVKQNFIEPLNHIQTKDLREVNHHRKKLSGRRLDYDCKLRKQKKGAHLSEEEISMAEDKFEESKQLAETAMWNLLENDVEQISALASFIEAEVNYHRQSADVLQTLHEDLQDKITQAASRPKRDHVPKRVGSSLRLDKSPGHEQNNYNSYGGSQNLNTPTTYPAYGSSREDISQVGQGDSQAPVMTNQNNGGNSYWGDQSNVTPSSQSAASDPFDPFGMGELSVNSFHSPDPGVQSDPLYSTVEYAKKSIKKPSRDDPWGDQSVPSDPTYSTVNYAQKANRRSIGGGGMSGGPCCKALYDFDPENEGELGFKEGDIITLIERIDDNWFEGQINGQSGFFPVNYVDVVVDLPH